MAAQEAVALLKVPGVGDAKWKLITENGYTTVPRLAMAKVTDLMAIEGIGEAVALKVIGAAQEASGIGAIRKSTAVYSSFMEHRRVLTSGSKAVDELLGGGFLSGFTYEIAGKNGHSKSQVVTQLLANCVSPKRLNPGFWEGRALLIDTENTSEPLSSRLHDFLIGNGVTDPADIVACMDRCDMVKCPNSESQVNVLRKLLEEGTKYDLICIDGVMTKFRAEFIGRATLAERQGILSDHLDDANVYADQHKALVAYTNQVSDSPELYGGTYAIGGNIVGHSGKYRIMVRKAGGQDSKAGKRILRLDKAPNLPEGEAVFLLTSEGITDVQAGKGTSE